METLLVTMLVLIVAGLIIPRILEFRQDSIVARNRKNIQELVNAIQRFQLEGHSLTNADTVETVAAQLVETSYLSASSKLTSRQITMIHTNGALFFYETYDD